MAKEGKNNSNAHLSPDNAPDSPELNIKNALFSFDTFKEALVLSAVGYILYSLVRMLGGFLSSLAEIFTKASAMYSAPIAVVKTLDWHIVFLGSALILSITTIACFMLGIVFGKKNSALLVTDSKESITTLTESVKSLVESVKSLIGTKKPD